MSSRKSRGRRKGTNEAQKGGQKCDEKAAERTKKCVMNQEKGEEEGGEKHFLIDIDRKPPRATTSSSGCWMVFAKCLQLSLIV